LRVFPFLSHLTADVEVTMASTTTGTSGGSVATDETDRLIASNKVEGTAVYNRQGERLGEVDNFMVDKYSGQVAYAVMSFGGFLGIGESYHPLPWRVLTYDTGLGGYVVDLDKDKLQGAPSFTRDETPDWGNRDWGTRVHDYYGVRPYWGP
jgi:PRC-barrel domain